jgi:hypothetical protein
MIFTHKALQQNAYDKQPGTVWWFDASWGNILSETHAVALTTGHWKNNTIRFLWIRLSREQVIIMAGIRIAVRVTTNNNTGTAAVRIFDYAVNSVPDQAHFLRVKLRLHQLVQLQLMLCGLKKINNDISIGVSPNPVAGDILHVKISQRPLGCH